MTTKRLPYKLSERYDSNGKKTAGGLIFKNEVNREHDLREFEVLHTGIDTLEQKYQGTMNPFFLESILFRTYKDHLGQTHKMEDDFYTKRITHLGIQFHLTKANGRQSGYRYMMQNKSVGITVFFGYFHQKDWEENGGIKIKFSPQFIFNEGLEKCAKVADEFAASMMADFEHCGVEPHLCMDVQGWQPEKDFMSNIKCRSRVNRANPTMGSLEGYITLEDANVAHRYDDEKSFLFGRKGSSQLAVYCKNDEAKSTGKIQWWEQVYKKHMCFDKFKDVYRIEVRLPSQVTSKLGVPEKGGAIESYDIKSIHDLPEHLPSLWKHGLYNLFRYHYADSKVVRPEWQFLADYPFMDLEFKDYMYQRVKITNTGNDSDRNIAQMLGHMAAYMAKEGVSNEQAEEILYNFPEIDVINRYFREKGKTPEQWIAEFIDKLEDKRIDLAPVYETPFPHIQTDKKRDEIPF